MNEANILIYLATVMVAITLGLQSFKRRFLPIARPMISLSILWGTFSALRALELVGLEPNQWLSQFLLDFNFILTTFTVPLWVWMLLEFHLEKKVKLTDKRMLFFYINPLILYILFSIDVISNGFLSKESSLALITPEERIGSYGAIREIYGWGIVVFLVTVTPYLMIKKQHSSVWDIIQMIIYTVLPFVFYIFSQLNIFQVRLAAPAFMVYLFWIRRQYRLLDVMPVALKSVLDKVDSGILVSNLQSKLLYANDYATQLLDLKLSKKDLQQHKQLIPILLKQHFDFSKPEKQEAQITRNIVKKTNNGKKQEKCYIDAILQPIFNPKTNKHLGATVSLHDVTKRQQTELALQSLDRQKAKFFAGISHEFRTPLTLSLGNLDDVLNNAQHISADDLKTSLLQVKRNNKRLLNLVNQLLELSRADAGTLQIQPVLVHLNTYLPQLIANFESLANKQNIQISLQLEPAEAERFDIYFDESSFDKIILNLVSNAMKSINNGGKVTITLRLVDDHSIQLSVRDTGCGIPSEALPQVFKMFYSHESNNTIWPQGTGVGLSLVKQLLNQHGADIEVNSTEGHGTVFTLNLQRGFQHFPKEVVVRHFATSAYHMQKNSDLLIELETELVDTPIDNKATLKLYEQRNPDEISEKLVLLVDDNAEMRAYIRKHLARHFRLIEAADGEEALEFALQSIPDLVLSDVMMPKMNGYDLCKHLKSNTQTSHIPVLLLTAKSSQSEKLEGLDLGADDYLSKPFDVKELTLRMSNLIAARETIQQFYKSNGLQRVIKNQNLPKSETDFLDTLQKYVQDNISNTDIKVSDLAATVYISERSLSRKLKALTGETPKKMLLLIRLEYAAELLCSTSDSITQLSYRAGFADASHFTRKFKAHYSMTPTAYRKKHLAKCL